MKSWCNKDVQIKDGPKRRFTALLLFPTLKIQISQYFKENCALCKYSQNVLNIQHLWKKVQRYFFFYFSSLHFLLQRISNWLDTFEVQDMSLSLTGIKCDKKNPEFKNPNVINLNSSKVLKLVK